MATYTGSHYPGLTISDSNTIASGGVVRGEEGSSSPREPGGYGVDLTSGYLLNLGTIYGGRSYTGPAGGIGVEVGDGGTLTNAGHINGGYGISGLSDGGVGVDLVSGGTLTNRSGGVIEGGYDKAKSASAGGSGGIGVKLAAGGTLTNAGTISGGYGGYGQEVGGGGGTGVDLASGGTLTNESGGIIEGGQGGGAHLDQGGGEGGDGVDLVNGGTLINAGTIKDGNGGASPSGNGHSGDSVQFQGSGHSTLIIDPGAVFSGKVVALGKNSTIELAAGTSTGTISGIGDEYSQYSGFSHIQVDGGASWNLAGTNTFLYGVTVGESGTLTLTGSLSTGGVVTGGTGSAGGTGGNGVDLASGGSLGNYSYTVVSGGLPTLVGGIINGGAGYTSSSSLNGGTGGVGVDAVGNARLTNYGTIEGGAGGSSTGGGGGTGGNGVDLASGGTLANGDAISGGDGGYGQDVGGGGGTGVDLAGGGTLTNAGTISGGGGGRANTIFGSDGRAGDAVYFGKGASRLIIDPGAVFLGNVVANASYNNTIDLAYVRFGSGTGTLSGIGSQFTGFDAIQEDANANWDLAANNTFSGAGGSTGGSGTSGGKGGHASDGVDVDVAAGGALNSYATITAGTGGTGGTGSSSTPGIGGLGGIGGIGINFQGAGSLTNDGKISGGAGGKGGFGYNGGAGGDAGIGVYFTDAGTLTNDGQISGGAGGAGGTGDDIGGNGGLGDYGVKFLAGGTLTNDGTISGGAGGQGTDGGTNGPSADAVFFGKGNSRLIIGQGGVFDGKVAANASYNNTIELISVTGTGTLSGVGSQYTGFDTIQVDANARWDLASTDTFTGTAGTSAPAPPLRAARAASASISWVREP